MAALINIPGVGIISMDTQADVDNANSFLDIVLLRGSIVHTNMDSEAEGSLIDPFINTEDLSINGMGYNTAKLKGYTQVEWDAIFGTNSTFKPSQNTIPTSVNATSTIVDQSKAQKARAARLAPPPSWVTYSCLSTVLQFVLFDCFKSSGACNGNNADGSIVWSIHCADPLPAQTGPNAYYEWSVIDSLGTVVHAGIYDGGAGTVTESVGSGVITSLPPSSFTQSNFQTNGLLPGNYTCSIFNFTGGGNTYGTYNISGVVLGSTPLNCIPGDPNYDVSCCPPIIYGCTDPAATNYDPTATNDDGSCTYPPPPPPPPAGNPPMQEDGCPCEGAQNCEECGDNGNY